MLGLAKGVLEFPSRETGIVVELFFLPFADHLRVNDMHRYLWGCGFCVEEGGGVVLFSFFLVYFPVRLVMITLEVSL